MKLTPKIAAEIDAAVAQLLKERRCARCKAILSKDGFDHCALCRAAQEKARDRTRYKSRELQAKGLLRHGPCEVCGSGVDVENHHPDYTDATNIKRLCRYHHDMEHVAIDDGRLPPLISAVIRPIDEGTVRVPGPQIGKPKITRRPRIGGDE